MGIDEALVKRPTERNIGSRTTPPRAAANFFAKVEFGVGEIEPPLIPYQAQKLQRKPWPLSGADLKRAAENDVARQEKFGAR